MKDKKKAVKPDPNRYALLAHANDVPKATSKQNSTRSDASKPPRVVSRSPSPAPSTTSLSLNFTATRLETYPTTWTFNNLPPTRLARCGLAYNEAEKTCVCPSCELVIDVPTREYEGAKDEELLSLHEAGCVLADCIHDMIFNRWYETITDDDPDPDSNSNAASAPVPAPVPTSSPYPPPSSSTIQSSLTITAETPTSPTQSDNLRAPCTSPTYAAVAARQPLSAPETPSRPTTQSKTDFRSAESLPSPSASPDAPSPSPPPSRVCQTRTTSPVLSVHDLEQRYRNQPSPFSLATYSRSGGEQPSMSSILPRLLYTIADLLQGCSHSGTAPPQPQWYSEQRLQRWPETWSQPFQTPQNNRRGSATSSNERGRR